MKTTPSFRLLTLAGALAFVLSAPVSRAILLDWDTLTWTPGALTQSFDIDPGNLGNDVTVTIGGDTSFLTGSSPKLSTALTGGLLPVEKSLLLSAVWNTTAQAVTVTVDFHYGSFGVTQVAYKLFDVDTGTGDLTTAVDQIRGISATSTAPSTVGPTITAGTANVLTGSGSFATDQVVTGTAESPPTSASGNVSIDYVGTPLTQFVFTFGNDASATTPPTGQSIALHDISFTPVPEAGTVAACAVFSLLGAWGLRRMRRGQAETVES
jgi:hypothetical protein